MVPLYNIKEIDINPTVIPQIREIVKEIIYSLNAETSISAKPKLEKKALSVVI